MPQLMPLSWVFSSMMVLLLLLSASVIFSENLIFSNSLCMVGLEKSKLNVWFW